MICLRCRMMGLRGRLLDNRLRFGRWRGGWEGRVLRVGEVEGEERGIAVCYSRCGRAGSQRRSRMLRLYGVRQCLDRRRVSKPPTVDLFNVEIFAPVTTTNTCVLVHWQHEMLLDLLR